MPKAAQDVWTEADELTFNVNWIVSNLDQAAVGDDAAYALTNAIDALLRHRFRGDFVPTLPHCVCMINAIQRASRNVPELLPVDPITLAHGLAAASTFVRNCWVVGDWSALPARDRRILTMRLKVLRNATHNVALQRELDADGRASAVIFQLKRRPVAPVGAPSTTTASIHFLESIDAADRLTSVAQGLRAVASMHDAGTLDDASADDRLQVGALIAAAAARVLVSDAAAQLDRHDFICGMGAAIGIVDPERRDDDHFNGERREHVALLAAKLDAITIEANIQKRGDGLRAAYMAAENEARSV